MDRIVLCWFLSLLTVSFCYWMPTNAQEKERQQQDISRLFDDLPEDEKQFVALKQEASRDQNDGPSQSYRRKRVCSVGGGMSNQCTAGEIDRQMKVRELLMNSRGPGKRRVQTSSGADVEESGAASSSSSVDIPSLDIVVLDRRPEETATKKKGLQLLVEILSQMEADSTQKKKRACQFNLGGHCSTESAAFLADRWHYLDSAMSPGRKRSQPSQAGGITRKLVKGKLFADDE